MYKAERDSELNRLARQCVDDSDRWFGDMPAAKSVPHHALAMCGEVGEFANVIKKIERGSLDLSQASTRVAVASELTDVLVYLLNLAGLMNIDLTATYEAVRRNNERRFTAERRQREARRAAYSGNAGTERIV